jgi:hypothetical protein
MDRRRDARALAADDGIMNRLDGLLATLAVLITAI